jgi:FKBP-type peptidyl-prolyl cis-trans isomerase FklB
MRWIAVLLAAHTASCAAQTPEQNSAPEQNAAPQAAATPAAPAAAAPGVEQGVVTTASGLRIQTLTAGTGAAPEPGGAVLVSYEGKLANGTVFDATQEPVGLPVSALVPGFTEALLMMRVGGRYRIWIPPNLAYGEAGAGGGVVPPNAELEFTITLHDVGRPGPAPATPIGQ